MPIQVEYIKDNRAVLQTYTDPLDNVQMRQLKDKMEQEVFPAAPQKLHIIADFRAVWNLPGTILTSGSTMLASAHPKTGMIILVTKNSFVNTMANIFSKLAPKQTFKIVQSIEQAYSELDRLIAQES